MFLIGNNPKLKISDDMRKELGILESEMAKLEVERKEVIRRAARSQGLIAEDLKHLKSESGEIFTEESEDSINETIGKVLRASAGKDREETAYFCGRNIFGKKTIGCGWVKGRPNESPYNTIGFLSGSEGVKYHCHICNDEIGEFVIKQS